MVEQNPWKTPFGRLIIGSAVVAAAIGFIAAASMAGYLRSPAAAEQTSANLDAGLNVGDENVSEYAEEYRATDQADDAIGDADDALAAAAPEEQQSQQYYTSADESTDTPSNPEALDVRTVPSEYSDGADLNSSSGTLASNEGTEQ